MKRHLLFSFFLEMPGILVCVVGGIATVFSGAAALGGTRFPEPGLLAAIGERTRTPGKSEPEAIAASRGNRRKKRRSRLGLRQPAAALQRGQPAGREEPGDRRVATAAAQRPPEIA